MSLNTGPFPQQLERFLNSEWAFGLTHVAGKRRRRLLILLAGVSWGCLAYLSRLPTAAVFILPYYFVRIFTDLRVLAVLLVTILCLQFLGAIVLLLLKKPAFRLRYWWPSLLLLLLGLQRLLWSPLPNPDLEAIGFRWDFFTYPFQAMLFTPSVLRKVLLVWLSFWVAYRTAAIYLDDIYELEKRAAALSSRSSGKVTSFSSSRWLKQAEVARRFILQTAFDIQPNFIAIHGGNVIQEYKSSPIYLIGGPGRVRVHLDSAALFETIDGKPHVIGPTNDNKTGDVAFLSGFERLRSIIDLTDQMERYQIRGRTRDGIPIELKDVVVIFSVDRAGKSPSLKQPYPFSPLALQRLVYGQGQGPWVEANKSLIRRRFSEFIARHNLSEFLAAIGSPEIQDEQLQQAELQLEAARLAGVQLQANPASQLSAPDFHARPDIMTETFSSEFAREARRRGLEIKWIGGGTWVLPAPILAHRHVEAWKLSRDNLLRGHPLALERLALESEVNEFIRLVQGVPLRNFKPSSQNDAIQALRQILIAYHQALLAAHQSFQQQGHDPTQQERLRKVLVFLSRFTARWLGGP